MILLFYLVISGPPAVTLVARCHMVNPGSGANGYSPLFRLMAILTPPAETTYDWTPRGTNLRDHNVPTVCMDWTSSLPPLDWTSFLPPFFGVIAAFIMQWFANYLNSRRMKKALLIRLRAELKLAKDRLSENVGHTVPMASWKLAINSGRAMLLPHGVLDKINDIYFALENYDYEIKLVRGFSESARSSEGAPDHTAKSRLASVRWKQAVKMQEDMASAIDSLLKEDFWPKESL